MELKKIAIHSVPRSGSTWLGSIFDSSKNTAYRFQPLFSYGHKDQIDNNSSLKSINDFFNDLRYTDDPFVLQQNAINEQRVPQFNKGEITHIVYKEVRYHHVLQNLLQKNSEIKIIGLIRNPFATINSWLNAPKEFKKELGWEIEKEWKDAPSKNLNKIEEFNGYNKWKEVTQLFLNLRNEYPDQFYLLSYGELLQNTEAVIKNVFEFCDLIFSDQTKEFINKSTSYIANDVDAYSVFKSKKKDDAWKTELPDFIKKEIKNDPDFKTLNLQFKWY